MRKKWRREGEGGEHAEGKSSGAGRKEGCCEGKENSFLSNPQEDSLRCQKSVARH